ncbi:YgfZ/GcvT domain-containing protein [Plastorhodobacter daqingensis]|uniref:YgfZ/GcvT domain-containing protein n=1 Tax=Plastorhodobacter daqingensis TaxID=1387281 RepID=A0ABW2UGV2_9RHOB
MTGEHADNRRLLEVKGPDRRDFLQNLVTNDVDRLAQGLVYAALLSPQGKYLADFFLVPAEDSILIDVHADLAEPLLRRLAMYKLRANVTITPGDLAVSRGRGPVPAGAFADPRHAELGWRLYGAAGASAPGIDWDTLRVAHLVPESGIELIPDESYILECGFERLNGVDFRKGCYVGQEVTARMKHKTELRKGLALVALESPVPVGTEILAEGKPAGRVFTQAEGRGIAYLRHDRVGPQMFAAGVAVTPV